MALSVVGDRTESSHIILLRQPIGVGREATLLCPMLRRADQPQIRCRRLSHFESVAGVRQTG